MSVLGKACLLAAALITVLCLVFMFTGYFQAPVNRLGPDPSFHGGGISGSIFPIVVVVAVALLSLIFWPKRR